VSFTVNKVVINIFTIDGVTTPVTGAFPAQSITETTQYKGSVIWDNGNPSTFAASTIYTATITLTAKTGYTLTGVPVNSFNTVAGATSVIGNAADSGVIKATFPKTNDEGVKVFITFNIPDGHTITNNSTLGTGQTNYNYTALSSSTSGQKLVFVTTLTDAVWTFSDGTVLTATSNDTTVTINYNNNTSILPKLTKGSHYINVTGKDGKGVNQSAYVEITVKN